MLTAIHLRMQSPYELRPAQFRRVARITAEASANAGFYWQDLTNALADYTGGNAVVGEASPRLASLLRAATRCRSRPPCPPVRPPARPRGWCCAAQSTRSA